MYIIFQYFCKKPETTDRGKDYEHLFITYIILKLLKKEDIEDFYISSNDDNFGLFDDVVFEIKYYDSNVETWAFQLKHKQNQVITKKTLEKLRDDFSLRQYYQDYFLHPQLSNKATKTILFTNCKIQDEVNPLQVVLKDSTITVKVEIQNIDETDLFATSKGKSYTFIPDHEIPDHPDHEKFFKNFFLYAGQFNSEQLKIDCLKKFQNMFYCDETAFYEFYNSIIEWSMIEGKNKEKLMKKWIKRVIIHQVLSPFIKPLFLKLNSSISNKEELLQRAIGKFQITVFDKKRYKTVKNIWQNILNDVDIKDLNKIRKKYFVMANYIADLDKLGNENIQLNKLLWLMNKCPLVLDGNPKVRPVIDFSENEHFILLSPSNGFKDINYFQNLPKLKTEKLIYKDIVDEFTVSIEGQQEVSLRKLINECQELENIITTDELAQMTEGPLLLGKIEEDLPSCYINRTLPRVLIKLEFLHEYDENTIVVISEIKNLDKFKSMYKQHKIISLTTKEVYGTGDKIVYIYENECSQDEFEEVCSENLGARNCHQFKYFNENLDWIRSKNGVEELRRFQIKTYETLGEMELFNSPNLINVICENAGMGKTVLMQSLKKNSSSKNWTILIYTRNHGLYFRKNGSNVQKCLDYIVNYSCKNYTILEQEILRNMAKTSHLVLLWDGLDKMSDTSLEHIKKVILGISKMGLRQWITARKNLQQVLEMEFSVFSRTIEEFTEEEQKKYIESRLNCNTEKLSVIFETIQNNIQLFPNNKILGIPLQIYMITELFFENNIEKYLHLLSTIFTVADLYEQFVDKIIYSNYEEKRNFNFNIDANWEDFEENKTLIINRYKKIAVQVYFEGQFELTSDTLAFLTKLKTSKDPIGFIIKVTEDNNFQFLHNSYGEYFTALYLSENFSEISFVEDFLINERYYNIRFFLDLIVGKDSKAHIAVIYRNSQLLEQCTERDIFQKDKVGRNSFEVSCTWSKKYPADLETLKRTTYSLISNNAVYKVLKNNFEYFSYTDVESYLVQFKRCNLDLKKVLLLFPFMTPLGQFMLDQDYVPTILFYAVKFDYPLVFSYIDNTVLTEIRICNTSTTLFDFAIESLAFNCIEHLMLNESFKRAVFKDERISFKICLQKSIKLLNLFRKYGWDINQLHSDSGMAVLHYICQSGKHEMDLFMFLLRNGAKINLVDQNRNLPIHYLFLNNSLEWVEIFIMNGAKVDIPDANGKTVINYACESQEYGYNIFKSLFQYHININISDKNGKTAIFDACLYQNLKVVKLLFKNGFEFNIPDFNGKLPIYYASMNKSISDSYEIIKFLLENGTKIDDDFKMLIQLSNKNGWVDILNILVAQGLNLFYCDDDGKIPFHYVCQHGSVETVRLLIQNDVSSESIHLVDRSGRMPIHYACESGFVEIVELLIQNGANVNVEDGDGKMPIHYACKSGSVKTVSLLIEKGARVNGGTSIMPIFYASTEDVFNLLITRVADINILGSNRETLIHFAVLNKWLETTKFLIQKGIDINTCDENGKTPLHYASYNGLTNCVNLLIENGAKMNECDLDGKYPIHYACNPFYFDTFKMLVLKGAKLDVSDNDGKKPIHIVAKFESVNFIKLLIDSNAEIEISDDLGVYPMHYACKNVLSGPEVVSILLKSNVNINIRDQNGRSPVFYACQNNVYGSDIIKLLYKQDVIISFEDYKILFDYACKNHSEGFNIASFLIEKYREFANATDDGGNILIRYAFENNRVDISNLVIKRCFSVKTCINIPDSEGRMLIHIACEKDWPVIVKELINQGASVDVVDNKGRKPIDCVPQNSSYYKEILKWLNMVNQNKI